MNGVLWPDAHLAAAASETDSENTSFAHMASQPHIQLCTQNAMGGCAPAVNYIVASTFYSVTHWNALVEKVPHSSYLPHVQRRKEREMQEIKMALERENLDLEERRKKSSGLVGSLVIPVDEGFEEEKVEETKSSVSTSLHHTQFINFANARKRQIEKRASAKSKKRGEELLDMIRLDAMSYSLFDIAPIPYEVYMKSYGRSNAVQALAQTNEDNLSEEVQTDEIICKNKWTQKPVSFCTKIDSKINDKKKDLLMFSQEHLGVGGDFLEENALGWSNRIKTDSARFNQFLSTTGQVMLILLEESYTQNGGELIMNPVDLGFSDGFTSLGVSDVPFLAERAVTSICFPHHLTTMLLTVHQRLQRAACTDYNPVLGRSLICVWNTLEPSSPQKILVAGQEVTACYLESSHAGLVFGGLADGSVCIWDLREPSSYHTMVTAADQSQWIIRSPTYNTAEILREEGHLGPVVALQPFIEAESKSDTYYSNELSPTQVCSLEESGIIMVWTVIQSQEKGSKSGMSQQDLGLAHWGRVLLHRSSTIRIQDTLALDSVHRNNLQCYDLRMDVQDTEHLYVATNTGQVVHCLKSGGKPSPRTYIPNCVVELSVVELNTTSALANYATEGVYRVTKVTKKTLMGGKNNESREFRECFKDSAIHSLHVMACAGRKLPDCFVCDSNDKVGGIEGSVRLHSRASEKPLTMLAGTGDVLGQGPPIIALQWSRCRPCVFFALDTSSRIHVWDLSAGDMYPQYSVPFSDKTITAIQLSPLSESGKETSQLVLATECGKVEIHNLKPELNYQSTVEFNKELETFLRYTSIL
uniref:WD repeat-containing protein 60 n=1 Tax=Timema shepardi TaxID=629360 RepID=A0A7R9FUR7_TIMSH|nr:unnamed protein product [Timema shepardi]